MMIILMKERISKGLLHKVSTIPMMITILTRLILNLWTSVVRTRPRPIRTCSNNSFDWAASANINSCK
jgi:hypothetical protein